MFKSLFQREFFHDKIVLGLGLLGFGLGIVNVLYVVLQIKQQDFEVPIRFTEYGASPVELGEWYTLYSLAVFAGLATIFNLAISMKLRPLGRYLSVGILLLHVVVMVFLFFVSQALFNLSPAS